MPARRVIITGANSGIGKAAAIRFASEGYEVIIACRDKERSNSALNDVISESGNPRVKLMSLDLSSFKSIKLFSQTFLDKYKRLDVLIHNAGYFNHGIKSYQFSEDSLELTFATNTFGPLLLTELLLPALSRSSDPRILNAGSTSIKKFYDPKRAIEFDNLKGEFADTKPYSVFKMYPESKMGLLLLTFKLAEEYKEKGIKVNMLMIPATKVGRETMKKFTSIFKIVGPLIQNVNPFSKDPEYIADRYFEICDSTRFEKTSGRLLDHKLRIIQAPIGDGPMNPLKVLKELISTREFPHYAGKPEIVSRMWRLSSEIISKVSTQ
jgi:NAD(P)-dependent dehydrogenase (short-subunit alcohol dehydrogenase family)